MKAEQNITPVDALLAVGQAIHERLRLEEAAIEEAEHGPDAQHE